MRSDRRPARMIAFLSFVVVSTACLAAVPPAQAGPIGDYIARHRQQNQLKLPPMDPPFSKKPVRDLNVKTTSLTSRLRQRLTFKKTPTSGTIPFQDRNVTKASQ